MQLVVIPTSSTVLKVQWLPPVNHDRVSIVYDVECTLVYDEDTEVSVTRNKTIVGLPETNFMLTSLLPYMVYVVKVTARNEEGSSAANMVQARTFSASKHILVRSPIKCACISRAVCSISYHPMRR